MTTKKFFIALALLACAFTYTANAQLALSPDLFGGFVPNNDVLEVEYSVMNADIRRTVAKVQTDRLRSNNAETKQEAMQHVIYLAHYYPEAINPHRASARLYEIYRLDRNESFRVMALAGLHAIGSENTMRQMSQDVRLEGSDRVRRLTNAALVDYFGNQAK